MLATLTERRNFGDEWLLERKLDGERCVARKVGSDVRLESRTGKDLTSTYPEVSAAVAAQSSRELLLDGEDLTGRPLVERRARLTKAIESSSVLQHTEAWSNDSERRFVAACQSGWEGLIAKRADAPYIAGRSKNWLKLKCVWEQELVIGGYSDPRGSRQAFGALLVGYYERGSLRYAGKVGTGYTQAILHDLGNRLRKLETAEPAFVDARPVPPGTHWTRPELVAQIGFAEWTSDGRLRQPRFLGLRDDKKPTDVVRERPK